MEVALVKWHGGRAKVNTVSFATGTRKAGDKKFSMTSWIISPDLLEASGIAKGDFVNFLYDPDTRRIRIVKDKEKGYRVFHSGCQRTKSGYVHHSAWPLLPNTKKRIKLTNVVAVTDVIGGTVPKEGR